MNIIIEGPDNSGKSTLASAMQYATGKRLILSHGKPANVRERIDSLKGLHSVIFDRHPCISDLIYSEARMDPPTVTVEEVNEFYQRPAIFIYCEPLYRGPGAGKSTETEDHLDMVRTKSVLINRLYREWALQHAHFIYRIGDPIVFIIDRVQNFDPVQDVQRFMEKFEQTYNGNPRSLPRDLANFREDFMREEQDEYLKNSRALEALLEEDPTNDEAITLLLAQILDAFMDKMYVDIGTALLHGFNPRILRAAWERVHNANMKKIKVAKRSESTRHSLYDVRKPADFTPPDHRDLIANHSHR